jgi:hypothetical protein
MQILSKALGKGIEEEKGGSKNIEEKKTGRGKT